MEKGEGGELQNITKIMSYSVRSLLGELLNPCSICYSVENEENEANMDHVEQNIFRAIKDGKYDIVRAMLAAGFDVEMRDT
ncbi:hypothetical protein SARC_16627, partial [Sphaeroforma arctica JP610]